MVMLASRLQFGQTRPSPLVPHRPTPVRIPISPSSRPTRPSFALFMFQSAENRFGRPHFHRRGNFWVKFCKIQFCKKEYNNLKQQMALINVSSYSALQKRASALDCLWPPFPTTTNSKTQKNNKAINEDGFYADDVQFTKGKRGRVCICGDIII